MNFLAFVVCHKEMVAGFSCAHVSYYRTRHELEPKPRFLHNPRGTLQRIYLLLLEQRAEFTALFLADNVWKLAVIPTVEMCQLLMGLSIDMPFPEDKREIDIVVLTVSLQTTGSHTLTYQSYHSFPANTPRHVYLNTHAHTVVCSYISNLSSIFLSHSLSPTGLTKTISLQRTDRQLQHDINYLVTL